MKKITLFVLCCFALATSAMAVDWPETYSYANNGSWFGNEPANAGDDYPRSIAEAKSFEELALPEDAATFDALYASIGEEYGIDKLRSDEGQVVDATPAKFKVAYAGEAIYVLITYDAPTAEGMKAEIMFCPFDKLQNAPEPGAEFAEFDKTGVPWLRIRELGGFKVETTLTDLTFGVGGFMACTNGVSGYSQTMPASEGITLSDCSNSEAVKLAFQIEYYPMDNTFDTENPIEFSYELWKAACEGKGVSFEVKFCKAANSEYMWNTDNNNVYYSNSFAGYLKPGYLFSAEDVAAAPNLSVKGDLIQLAEAGNIQIFNAAGMLVASVSNVTELSTSGLAAGVYIAVSGNESISFVK